MLKKLMIPVVVLAIGAVAVLFVLPKLGILNVGIGGQSGVAAVEATPTPGADVAVPFSLGERIVNLADEGGYRYLKTEIILEFSLPSEQARELKIDEGSQNTSGHAADGTASATSLNPLEVEMQPLMPRVQDILTTVLSSRLVDEVTTSTGKDELKRELLEMLTPVFDGYHISDVYFSQFVIQ